MFCPKCKSILTVRKVNGKKQMACSCGYSEKPSGTTLKGEVLKHGPEIEVVEKEEVMLPKTEAHCERCGHKTAYFWTVQTRAADEPETKFLRCENCKHTWRDYS